MAEFIPKYRNILSLCETNFNMLTPLILPDNPYFGANEPLVDLY